MECPAVLQGEHSWRSVVWAVSRLAAEIVTLNLVLCLAEMRFSFGFFTGTRIFALSLHTFAKQSKADVPTALHRTPVVPLWV